MSKVQNYKRMKTDLDSLEKKVVGLGEEQRKLDLEFEPKSDEALRLKILEDPRAAQVKKDLEELKERRTQIKDELEQAKRERRIMVDILGDHRSKAADEINKQNSKEFWAKAQVFAKKLQEAQHLEIELVEMRKKARKALTEIDASEGLCGIPAWPGAVLPSPTNGQVGVYASFCKFMKDHSRDKVELG